MRKLFAITAILVGTSLSAQAAPQLDFNMNATHPAGASISYAGGTTPLVGVNIGVDEVVGLSTPLNNNVTLDLSGPLVPGEPLDLNGDAVLSFTTGNLTAVVGSTYFFGGGGSISIVGDVSAIGIPAGTTLLTGTFTSAQVVAAGGTFKVTIATFLDVKDERLAAYYGLAGAPGWLGQMNLSFNAAGTPPNGFQSSSVLSGDVINTPLPEPTSLALLGMGVMGMMGYAARRRKAA